MISTLITAITKVLDHVHRKVDIKSPLKLYKKKTAKTKRNEYNVVKRDNVNENEYQNFKKKIAINEEYLFND